MSKKLEFTPGQLAVDLNKDEYNNPDRKYLKRPLAEAIDNIRYLRETTKNRGILLCMTEAEMKIIEAAMWLDKAVNISIHGV